MLAVFELVLNHPEIVSCFVLTYSSHLLLLGVVRRAALETLSMPVPTGESTSVRLDVAPAAVMVSAFAVASGVLVSNSEKCHTPM